MSLKTLEIKMMGTIIRITINHENSENLLENCVKLLNIYERKFSANDDFSELSRINKNAGILATNVDKELFNLIEIGKKYSLLEKSYLNVAIGPIIKLWNIGFFNARKPEDEEIKKSLKLVNPIDIIIDKEESLVYLKKKGMKIDLGSLAKGYIADKIKEYLEIMDVKSALINMGGNIVTLGKAIHSSGDWKIGIQNPKEKRGSHIFRIKLNDMAIATSGIYERKFICNNEEYHHIFDSKTGYPIKTDISSLTIIAKTGLECEIWTTVLFGEKKEKIIEIIEKKNDIEAIIICNNSDIYYTSGIEKYII